MIFAAAIQNSASRACQKISNSSSAFAKLVRVTAALPVKLPLRGLCAIRRSRAPSSALATPSNPKASCARVNLSSPPKKSRKSKAQRRQLPPGESNRAAAELRSALLHPISPDRRTLCPLVVRPPALDELLDGLAFCQLFVQNFSRQRRQFRIARKPQRDDLSDVELAGSRLQIRRQHLCVPQAFLQTDDPILHRQGKQPRFENQDDQSRGQYHSKDSRKRKT